jgi:hypothetical protein
MRLNLPVFVGIAVIVTGLGMLLLWQPEPTPQELAAVSLARLRGELREKGLMEGRDFILDSPVILRRDDEEMIVRLDIRFPNLEPGREYHRLVRTGKGWEFDRDLGKSFREFVERESKPASDRLAKRLAERYQDAVNIPAEKVRIAHRLRESTSPGSPDVRVIGSIDIRFIDGGGEGRYVEDFTFTNGTWTMEGQTGQLFDRGPRAPSQ